VTGPTAGVLVGGFITNHCIGGYTNRRALLLCFLVACLAAISAFPIPFLDKLFEVIGCMWALLFFGGFIMPNMTGILLNSVPYRERAIANSVANFFYNMIGYLPAPYLYGIIASWTEVLNAKGQNISRYGMVMLMFSPIIGVGSLAVALWVRKRSRERAKKLAAEGYEGIGEPIEESSSDEEDSFDLQLMQKQGQS